jgi:hypothetical protein
MRFSTIEISRDHRYALERDTETGAPVLSIPVSNGIVDYCEYYTISESELARFLNDEAAAASFAIECGRRERDDRLVIKPGAARGVY